MSVQRVIGALLFYGRFAASFSHIGYRWRRRRWQRVPMDFSGQRWWVTGASGGLGEAIARAAAAAGAHVTAVARDPMKLDRLPVGIEKACCDVAVREQVDRLVAACAASNRQIDVLVNNVGVLLDRHGLTREGCEISYATNLLSHYQLTESLIAKNLLAPGALVINMTSGGAYAAPLRVDALDARSPVDFDGTTAYALHKRAQIALNSYWQSRYSSRGITFYVMHPGWADTSGVQRSLPQFRRWMAPILRDAAAGADTALWLAAMRPRAAEGLWFDRALRPAHVYGFTQQGDPTSALIDKLERDLKR